MIDKKFEELLTKKIEMSNGGQMEADEYRYIASYLGNKNFLVFGTGHDTPLWRYANRNGTTIFLENVEKWMNPADTDVIKVNYTTKLSQYLDLLEEYKQGNVSNLKMDLPDIVTNTKWDCIFVDSPVGTKPKKPGRMQSIYTASVLASKNTNVFVHDTDRLCEDIYSKEMFSQHIKDLTKLRHVKK